MQLIDPVVIKIASSPVTSPEFWQTQTPWFSRKSVHYHRGNGLKRRSLLSRVFLIVARVLTENRHSILRNRVLQQITYVVVLREPTALNFRGFVRGRYGDDNTVRDKLVNTHVYPMASFQSQKNGQAKRSITRSICPEYTVSVSIKAELSRTTSLKLLWLCAQLCSGKTRLQHERKREREMDRLLLYSKTHVPYCFLTRHHTRHAHFAPQLLHASHIRAGFTQSTEFLRTTQFSGKME